MRPLLILTALLAATSSVAQSAPAPAAAPAPTPAPEAPRSMLLVWGGGKTPQEAEAAAKDYRERAGDWKQVLTLAEGYPRILASDTVPGLKPGFHVVVLGVCEPTEGATIEAAFDALEPRTYSREVSWPEKGKLPCPQLAYYWSFEKSVRAKGKQGDLLAAFFSASEAEGDFEMHGWHVVFTAFDKQGKRLGTRTESSGTTYSDLQQLEAKGARLLMKERKLDPPCHGAPSFEVVERTWSARLDGEDITIDSGTTKSVESGSCS
jgi:hypothetical protein